MNANVFRKHQYAGSFLIDPVKDIRSGACIFLFQIGSSHGIGTVWILIRFHRKKTCRFVDGKEYALSPKEALYIGRGHLGKDKKGQSLDTNKVIQFRSKDPKNPAKFYLNSATAHQHYKTQWITLDGRKGSLKAAVWGPVGSLEECNNRTVYKLIVNDVLEEGPCQLQLGLTQLNPGAAWNTMPPHTHGRRIEAYYYFNLPQEQTIAHIMGQPEESRVVWLHNDQAIMSPEWSMHAAAGTYYYTFIWGMAGENLYYNDKDNIPVIDIR